MLWTIIYKTGTNGNRKPYVVFQNKTCSDEVITNVIPLPNYRKQLKQHIEVKDEDIKAMSILMNVYSFQEAVKAIASFKFGGNDSILQTKFTLAPSLEESIEYITHLNKDSIKELLAQSGITIRKFSKIIQANEKTLRSKFSSKPEHKNSRLTLAEKYLALVVIASHLNK